MDKNLASQEIQILEIAKAICFNRQSYSKLKPHETSFVAQAYDIYLSNPEISVGTIIDIDSFCHFYGISDSLRDRLVSKIKTNSGIKETEIKKETSSVPVELETMVALYKEHQADLLDSESNNHTVADTVKRIRKSWSEREKIRLVYENAEKERQEKVDKYYQKVVNPKKDSREEINENSYKLAEIAILAQGAELSKEQLSDAVDNLVYWAETGAIEIDNYNELNVASAIAVKDQISIKTEFDQLDKLIQQKQKEQEEDPDSDEPSKLDGEIILANQEAENTFRTHSKNFRNQMEGVNKDYDVFIPEAKKEIEKVITSLGNANPNAKLQFQSPEISAQKIAELESLIRKVDSTALNINPSGLGARASETVSVTGGNMGPAIDLYSKGLTQKKLEELSNKPNNSEATALRKFLEENRSLKKHIERGLKKVQNSPLGKELDGVYKKVNYLIDPIGSGRTYINKQVGKKAGELILKSTNNAVAKKLGNFIIKDGLKAGAKKFADEVAKKIIIAAAKKAGVEGAKLAATTAASSALAAASAALGISTAGLSLIIEAAIALAVLQYKIYSWGFTQLRQQFISDKEWKESKKAAWIGLGALAATAFAVNRGAKMFGTATKAAVISAVGIIWLSLATIAVFLTLTFLTAPILTTLVQFDSVKKVQYDSLPPEKSGSDDCKWPISGNYQIVEGPDAGTHSKNHLQAIDIWGPDINGKPIISTTDGTVTATGNYSNYGNTVQIETTNSAGKFKVLYGHMSNISVSVGQQVKQGDKIGLVDSSSQFPEPHIHLEYQGIKYNDCPANGVRVRDGCTDYLNCGSINTN